MIDIDVAYDTDLTLAQGIMQHVADEVWRDDSFVDGDIIEPPEVWGVENLGADGVTLRLVVTTDPAEQWVVARELRLRIKQAFDAAGIEIPFPQRTVWVRENSPAPDIDLTAVPTTPPRRASGEAIDNPDVDS